jgi:hypothetical protein
VPPLLFYLWKKARDSLMKQEHDGGVNVQIKEPKRSARDYRPLRRQSPGRSASSAR